MNESIEAIREIVENYRASLATTRATAEVLRDRCNDLHAQAKQHRRQIDILVAALENIADCGDAHHAAVMARGALGDYLETERGTV